MTSSVFLLFTEQNKSRKELPPSSKRGNGGFGWTNIHDGSSVRWESGQRGHELNSESEQKFGPSSAKTQLKPNKHLSHLQAALVQGYKEHDIPEPRGKLEPVEGGTGTHGTPTQRWVLSSRFPASISKQAGCAAFFRSRQAMVHFPASAQRS